MTEANRRNRLPDPAPGEEATVPVSGPLPRRTRVVVGLSGGVDSAVAALLLRDQGAEVHGLHMTNWEDEDGYCTAASDLQDARRVAEDLGIPLHHVNFARAYRERVFEHFLAEYRAGRTPNPDVLCNREIKFGAFREYARRLGARCVATGHYAASGRVAGEAALFRGADRAKDQSYFLHQVPAEALAEARFPLGGMTKGGVRELARARGLPVYDKKDSTGICFIGERPFREFLAGYLPARSGPIRSSDGQVVGRHHGLMYYTIGQRQGLGIGGRRDTGGEPWYVADKDLESNSLIVVQGDDPMLYAAALEASGPRWIGKPPGALATAGVLACRAMIRYRQSPRPCRVSRLPGDRLLVAFDEPQRAVAPGQYAVFYAGDRCLGGAVIDRPLRQGLRAAAG